MATLHSPRLAPPPQAEGLLREELARFRSELQFVRASLESEALGKGTPLQAASELSSDDSDWGNDVPGHLESASYVRRLWKEPVVVTSASKKVAPELYAPNEPPTRQRPKRQLSDQLAKRENAVEASTFTQNPNPNLDVRNSQHPEAAEAFSPLMEEQAASYPTEAAYASMEKDGQAQEMASRIQQLLEGHGNAANSWDWTSLLGSSTEFSPKGQNLAVESGRQSKVGAGKTEGLSEALAKGKETKEAGVQAAKPGCEEAQAYLRRVLANLVPAQRLSPLEKPTSLGNIRTLEAEQKSEAVQEGKQGEVGVSEEKAVQTSLDNVQFGPRLQTNIPVDRKAHKPDTVAFAESNPGGPSRADSGTPPLIRSLGSDAASDRSAPWEPQEVHIEQDKVQLDTFNEEVDQEERAPESSAELLNPSAAAANEPAPRPKLALAPTLRGGLVHQPALKVSSCRTDQIAEDNEREGVQLAPPHSNSTTHSLEEERAESILEAGAKLESEQELPNREDKGARSVGQTPARGTATEMEKRMELLETVQRRALELEEQKLQHEISMHQRRAELQLQALEETSKRVNSEAEQDNLEPLRPASFLLGRARDAANEVNAAVSRLQSVELGDAPGTSTDPTGSPALSNQLATAVTELKEMLDKKLGEFYAACASFHAASLQGAAKLAQAAQEGQRQSDGETRAAAAHEMARQTAELDTLRKQVRGSHQKALQSPAFHLQTPQLTKPLSRARSRSSTASQSSKRGPQDLASAAAELASGLREFRGDQRPEAPASEWPGLDSAVEEAVRAAEGHGIERQLLTHAAHAKWREIAAREEERADSAKAAVQALLGDAFDYEAARKELDLITRVAKGMPKRAKERAKDSTFQALAYASASQKNTRTSELPRPQQQTDEARFLESLRQDVDRRIAAAAALSTGMNVGAKRRKISEPTEPLREMPDLLRAAKENVTTHAGGKENRSFAETERSRGKAQPQRREEKPVTLKKVEIAFGHKVEPKVTGEASKRQARKRKENDGNESWVKRMSEPRRPLESPGGESLEQKRESRHNVPRRSTLRPAEMLHRPATAVRWPSPEPRRPRTNDASTNVRGMVRKPGVWSEIETPMGRLAALAREAAVGVDYPDLLDERSEGQVSDGGGSNRTSERAPHSATGLEESAQQLTDWLSEQVLSQLLQQPSILEGLRRTESNDFSVEDVGLGASGAHPDVTGQPDDVSIDEELVRALAAEVISEEVERAVAEQRKKDNEAGLAKEAESDEAVDNRDERSLEIVPKALAQDESIEQQRKEDEERDRIGTEAPVENREDQAAKSVKVPASIRAEEPKQSEASTSMDDMEEGVSHPQRGPPIQSPLGSQFPQVFPFLPGMTSAVGWPPISSAGQSWPFVPFPFYYPSDARFFPGFQPPDAPPPQEKEKKQTTQTQTEPQLAALPTLKKIPSRRKGKESPATPPTPSTPSSSPEVTLVSRRNARRGFEAALETMGIHLQLDSESQAAIYKQETSVEIEEEDPTHRVEEGSVTENDEPPVEEARVAVDDHAAVQKLTEERDSEKPIEDAKKVPPEGRVAVDEAVQSETDDDVPLQNADTSAEKSPGSRTRRKWTFLDARWDARQAIDSMTRTLLMGAAEETSSRSGEATSSARGTASGSEATSVSFGEIAAGLLSEPSSVKVSGRPLAEPARVENKDAAATSSLSEGEAEPGDMRQDQEPGQQRRFALSELSTDSEPGLIAEQKGPVENYQAAETGRASREERDGADGSSDSDSAEIGRIPSRRSIRGSKRLHFQRSAPKREVIRNAVATLRGLASKRPEEGVSEGEMESGADEGEVGKVMKEAGQISGPR